MKKLALLGAGLVLSGSVLADPILCADSASNCAIPGFDPADMDQIHFDTAGSGVQTIIGSPTNPVTEPLYDVVFTSDEDLSHGSGFAIITADDGWINKLSFNIDDLILPEGSLGMEVAEFSLNARNDGNDGIPAEVMISYVMSDGTVGDFGLNSMYKGGENPFTIWTNDEIESVTLMSDAGFEVASFKHLRVDIDTVGNPDPVNVDAPSHAALLGLGLIGLVASRKRTTR